MTALGGKLRVKTEKLQKLRELFENVENDVRTQVHIALTKTAKGLKKDIGGRDGPIGAVLNCKVSKIKEAMPISHRLSDTGMSATMIFKTGRRIGLGNFGPKQLRMAREPLESAIGSIVTGQIKL